MSHHITPGRIRRWEKIIISHRGEYDMMVGENKVDVFISSKNFIQELYKIVLISAGRVQK